MKIEIYRKRFISDCIIVDDEPETVFCGVSWVEITDKAICGSINGEELAIKRDNANYKYFILNECAE